MDSSTAPSVAVLLLNWNSWGDCIECLESLLRQDYPNFSVILCDNGSTDGSVDRLKQWAAGELCAWPSSPDLARLVRPPVADRPDLRIIEKPAEPVREEPAGPRTITTFLAGENLGFAAGNNIGLRHALAAGYDYVWVLNADTVVEPDALAALVKRARQDPSIGLCGSLLCYYDAPDTVQEAGGCSYFPLVGLARRLAADRPRQHVTGQDGYERQLGYVSAASCLVSRAFLEEVGLMSEDYFLYCEEIDWATRARGRFRLGYAPGSVVYHKKGRATGSKSVATGRSPGSAYYLWRARTRFTRRYHKAGLPGLFAVGLAAMMISSLRGERGTGKAILVGLLDLSHP